MKSRRRHYCWSGSVNQNLHTPRYIWNTGNALPYRPASFATICLQNALPIMHSAQGMSRIMRCEPHHGKHMQMQWDMEACMGHRPVAAAPALSGIRSFQTQHACEAAMVISPCLNLRGTRHHLNCTIMDHHRLRATAS